MAQWLLLVDDDPDLRDLMAAVSRMAGFQVLEAASLSEVQAHLLDRHPDRVVLDLNLGDTDGVEVLELLAAERCAAPIVPISGVGERVLRTMVRIGEDLGLTMRPPLAKPFRLEAFRQALGASSLEPLERGDLERALAGGQTTLHFQPKIELATGRVVGVEALARWRHPVRGPVPTDDFIALAERSGLMHPFTLQNFRTATQAAAGWVEAGCPMQVAVNVSASSLAQSDLPDVFAGLCDEAGLDPARITIEITESAAMTDPAAATRVVTRLRLRGFALSLDDFGTGYSSLVELHRMPFSELKIDQQFVQDLDTDADAAAISKAIIDLGHALGLRIVAEGIERGAVAERLVDMGCDLGQGYHFAAALPAAELTRMLVDGPWRARRDTA